jgi:glycosyltransferase involved in cell wall biosynthesis
MPENQENITTNNKNLPRVAVLVGGEMLRDYGTCLRRLFVGLADKSYPGALICPPHKGAGSVLSPAVQLISHPVFQMRLLGFLNKKVLLDKLAKFKPTVLHCFGSNQARLAKYLARAMDIPYVLTFTSQPKGLLKLFIAANHCATLVASSNAIAEQLRKNYRAFADRIEQINVGTFVKDSCACFSEPPHLTSLVVAQPLDNAAGFELLLNAIKHLAVDGYDFTLAIIGRGPAERAIHKTIKSLGLSQIVTVVPDMQPLRAVFAGADIFVQFRDATDSDCHLLEAMSVGMAVAACGNGSCELLVENQTAVFFDSHDELSIFSCLQKLLGKREFARQLAMAGQNHLREHHSVSAMVESLLATYNNAQQWYKNSTG